MKGRHLTAYDVMVALNPEKVRSLFEKLGYAINEDSFEVSANTGFSPANVQNTEAGYFIADY